MAVPLAYHDQTRSVRMGILGFSIGLGLAGLTGATLQGRLDPDTFRLTMAIVYGAAGLFVGMLFGLTLRSPGALVLCILLATLGMGGGYYASQYVVDLVDPNVISPYLGPQIGPLAIPFVQAAFIGLLTGIGLGLAERRAGQIVRGALAGLLGMALAYLVQVAAYQPLFAYLLLPLADFVSGGAMGTLVPTVFSWGIAGALGGVVAGGIVGDMLA